MKFCARKMNIVLHSFADHAFYYLKLLFQLLYSCIRNLKGVVKILILLSIIIICRKNVPINKFNSQIFHAQQLIKYNICFLGVISYRTFVFQYKYINCKNPSAETTTMSS